MMTMSRELTVCSCPIVISIKTDTSKAATSIKGTEIMHHSVQQIICLGTGRVKWLQNVKPQSRLCWTLPTLLT